MRRKVQSNEPDASNGRKNLMEWNGTKTMKSLRSKEGIFKRKGKRGGKRNRGHPQKLKHRKKKKKPWKQIPRTWKKTRKLQSARYPFLNEGFACAPNQKLQQNGWLSIQLDQNGWFSIRKIWGKSRRKKSCHPKCKTKQIPNHPAKIFKPNRNYTSQTKINK